MFSPLASRDIGSIIKLGGHIDKGYLGRASRSEIKHLVWGVKQCKPTGRSGGMFLGEILKLRSSKITGNMHFSSYFCIFKAVK